MKHLSPISLVFPVLGSFIVLILCFSENLDNFWKGRLFLFTGQLKTSSPLDRERVPAYNLVARATDGGGRFCQSDIHLILEDVNDNPPVFSSDHYHACVYENTATKALLTRVQAVDPDIGKSVAPMGCLPIQGFNTFSGAFFPVVSSNPLWFLTKNVYTEPHFSSSDTVSSFTFYQRILNLFFF